MEITLQYFDGCPNWGTTDRHLSTLIGEMGIEVTMRRQPIDTPRAATKHGFRGSPTILINGVDPFADPAAPVGLSCRIYQTEHGPAGSPTREHLKRILATTQEKE